MDIYTVGEAFIKFLQDKGYGTFGTDLFLGELPIEAPDDAWLVVVGGETAKWRLKGHATKLFYQFVGSWAIMLNKPMDIGFEMNGYDLPKLNLLENQIKTPKRDNGSLFNDAIISATNFNQELRLTKIERLDEVVKLVNEKPDENYIIWIKQNEEGELLKKLLPDAIEVKGSYLS